MFNDPSIRTCQLIRHKSRIFSPVNRIVVISVFFHIENEGLNDELRNLSVFQKRKLAVHAGKVFIPPE